MVFDILTIFPGLLKSYLDDSIIWREIKKGTIKIRFHDIRKYSKDSHKKVDASPYGGGAGMVMTLQPIFDCVKAVKRKNPGAKVVYLSPKGKLLNHQMAQKLAKRKGLILLCGRYEGIDERVIKLCVDEEISIGEYVLTGGELPAMVIVDAVTRLLPKALGNKDSAKEDSFSAVLEGKKEYPHYTKPREFMGLSVPRVLLSGNHAKITAWRKRHLK
ncbi:MAG: tRNA (guanosine(37)-N1)-methyltransferase TrmD [Patescibacteria group bacterium]|mgnify:CR=1 FL=1